MPCVPVLSQYSTNKRWAAAAEGIDLNDDGCKDLVIGAFLAPGLLYVLLGDVEGPYSMSAAVTAAIVSGVLAALFFIGFEIKAYVSRDAYPWRKMFPFPKKNGRPRYITNPLETSWLKNNPALRF